MTDTTNAVTYRKKIDTRTREFCLHYADGSSDPYALLDYGQAKALTTYHPGAKVYGRQVSADGSATVWAEVVEASRG